MAVNHAAGVFCKWVINVEIKEFTIVYGFIVCPARTGKASILPPDPAPNRFGGRHPIIDAIADVSMGIITA